MGSSYSSNCKKTINTVTFCVECAFLINLLFPQTETYRNSLNTNIQQMIDNAEIACDEIEMKNIMLELKNFQFFQSISPQFFASYEIWINFLYKQSYTASGTNSSFTSYVNDLHKTFETFPLVIDSFVPEIKTKISEVVYKYYSQPPRIINDCLFLNMDSLASLSSNSPIEKSILTNWNLFNTTRDTSTLISTPIIQQRIVPQPPQLQIIQEPQIIQQPQYIQPIIQRQFIQPQIILPQRIESPRIIMEPRRVIMAPIVQQPPIIFPPRIGRPVIISPRMERPVIISPRIERPVII